MITLASSICSSDMMSGYIQAARCHFNFLLLVNETLSQFYMGKRVFVSQCLIWYLLCNVWSYCKVILKPSVSNFVVGYDNALVPMMFLLSHTADIFAVVLLCFVLLSAMFCISKKISGAAGLQPVIPQNLQKIAHKIDYVKTVTGYWTRPLPPWAKQLEELVLIWTTLCELIFYLQQKNRLLWNFVSLKDNITTDCSDLVSL